MDLSVVLPAKDEGPNLGVLLPALRRATDALGLRTEILVVTAGTDSICESAARQSGAQVLQQSTPGYGGALRCGFEAAAAEWILTMDADQSHRPDFLGDVWSARSRADLVIASRYVPGGRAIMPYGRYLLSRALNLAFRWGLNLDVADTSSGFRLYRKRVLPALASLPQNFDAIQTLLVRACADGWRVTEVPFTYQPRGYGRSTARLLRFGLDSAQTFFRLWGLRYASESADFEARSYDSPVPWRRYRQRLRVRHVTELVVGTKPVLGVATGSSRIISALPRGSVVVDTRLAKLRYARQYGASLVHVSGLVLPFRDASFPCVWYSPPIQDVRKEWAFLSELIRVLKPGGRLVLGGTVSRASLVSQFEKLGFVHEATRRIFPREVIFALRKPARWTGLELKNHL